MVTCFDCGIETDWTIPIESRGGLLCSDCFAEFVSEVAKAWTPPIRTKG